MRKKYRTFFVEFDEVEKTLRDKNDTVRLKLLAEVKKYAKECSYIQRKNAKEVIHYWSCPSEDVATILNLSDGSVRLIKTVLSDNLYRVFGGDYLERVCSGSVDDVRDCKLKLQILKSNTSAERYFPSEELDIMRASDEGKEFDISECKEEYMFLKKFCIQNFRAEYQVLDPNKVGFLLRVIEGKSGTSRDTYGFIKKFNELGAVLYESED